MLRDADELLDAQYAAHQEPTREPTFDFEQIDSLMHLARVQTGAWPRWFESHGIEPFAVTYEELCERPVEITLATLAFLGLELPGAITIARPPGLTKQADQVSADWIARYCALAGQPQRPAGAPAVSPPN
jgi:LPS sulfotransferase NodH